MPQVLSLYHATLEELSSSFLTNLHFGDWLFYLEVQKWRYLELDKICVLTASA